MYAIAVEREYWLNRWIEGLTGFHLNEANPLLERFLPEVSKGPGRALVPLCGKSLDLAWLASRGYEVTGADLSPIAARAVIPEPEEVREEASFRIFRKGPIAYYVGDFFDFKPEETPKFDLVYDRAALIALPPSMRPAYAKLLASLVAPAGHILLISLEYDQRAMDGPPFAVLETEVRALFAGLKVDKLFEHDLLEEEPRFKERGLTWMKETVYRLGASE